MNAMRHARIFLVLFVAVAVLAPVPAAAEFVSMGPASICPNGTAGNPSGAPKSFGFTSPATEVRSYLNKKVLCPSACFDEAVTLNVAMTGITVTVAGQNKCRKTEADPQAQDARKDNRGCDKGQTHPRVIVKITGLKEQIIPAKSRCDVSNLTGVINSVAEQRLSDALDGLDSLAQPDVGVAVVAPVDLGTPGGQRMVAEQLAAGFQIPVEQAEAIVAKDNLAAIRAIYAVSQGNEAAIKAEAESLGLNPNLTDKVALRAMLIKDGNLTDPETPGTLDISARSTFTEAPDTPAQPSIAEVLVPMCYQQGMGGCGEACSVPNPSTLTCAANNPGALTFTAWQAKYGGRPCGLANNTTCYDTIEGGIAAQANLLMTSPRYFGTGNNTILGAFCNGYSTSNCSQYAAFISSQTGIPVNQTIDPNNTQQIAAIMMASSRFENGRGVIYTPEQLQKGLQVALGTDVLPEGTPGYIARTMYGTNGGTQYGSAFSMNPAAPPAPTAIGYGSPFAQATPAPVAQTQTQSQASVQQTQAPQTSQQIQQVQNAVTGPSVAEQLQQALGGSTSTAAYSSAIVVEPQEVAKGGAVTVSWSSKDMSTASPCVVRVGSAVIAMGNAGSKVVTTSPLMSSGSLVFTLSCTSQSGTQTRRNAAVFVR